MKSLHRYFTHFAQFALFSAILLAAISAAQAQTISYLIPDIGTPGMNSYVEFIGPHNQDGNFGPDGLYFNNEGDPIRVKCATAGDTAKITIGPVVVSWNGKMISTQIFVHPDVAPNAATWNAVDPQFVVMLQVEVNGNSSNALPFYLVNPQPAILIGGGGIIGSGGAFGARSRRGAMIVDSINLNGGTYTVFNGDIDPIDAGNQGGLPLTLISKGPVRGTNGAVLSLNSGQLHAAPGGGGAGGKFCDVTGDGSLGGDGYTGGGRGGRNGSGAPFSSDIFQSPGQGTGPEVNNTGTSLNGVPGGTGPWYEAAGGGTGHPFGASGEGCADGGQCAPPAGYGGGAGASQLLDGGAGGYATRGQSSNGVNGGNIHGNGQLVPLAGGSGGAGGNPQGIAACSGEGGAGGGALRLFGTLLDDLTLTADGGTGGSSSGGTNAFGGSGSGGALSAESKLGTLLNRMSVPGGAGRRTGGAGRIRIDGPLTGVQREPATASFYTGVSTDTSKFTSRSFVITGTGNGEDIDLYLKSKQHPWHLVATISGYTGNAWQHSLVLPGTDDVYFFAAAQSVPAPSTGQHTTEPSYVLSQAAANIFQYQPIPIIAADTLRIFPVLRCGNTARDTMYVRNEGEGTLIISNAQFTAANFNFIEPPIPASVAPGDSIRLIVEFVPPTTGLFTSTLILANNDTARARNPFAIRYEAVKEDVGFNLQPAVIDLGTLACISSKDTVISIVNPFDTDIQILIPLITNPAVTLIDPPPANFPIMIGNNGSRELRIRIQSGTIGPDSTQVIIRSGVGYCVYEARAFVRWEWDDVSYNVSNLPEFAPMFCPGETRDTSFVLRNTGSADITFTGMGISNSAFALLSPAFPLTLQPGNSSAVTVRFTGTTVGVATGTLEFLVLPCNTTESIALRGEVFHTELTAAGTDFGLQAPGQLPVTQFISVTNQGTTPITLTDALFANAIPFRVISGFPITIQPGATELLNVEFFDPGFDSTFSVEMELVHTPSCNPLVVTISGARGEASATLEIGTVAGATGERIFIPVYLRNATNLQLHGATGITTELRMNATILYPMFTPRGNVVNGERIIPVTLPLTTDANDVAVVLEFTAMLGVVDQTAITPENSAAVGGTITITEAPGLFSLTNVCREGGDRLFDGSVTFGLAQNNPNPFNASTRISFTTIERGHVTLEVYNTVGKRIRTLVDTHAEPGTYSAVFDAGDLPSGLYRAVLRTATMTEMRTMVLAK